MRKSKVRIMVYNSETDTVEPSAMPSEENVALFAMRNETMRNKYIYFFEEVQ